MKGFMKLMSSPEFWDEVRKVINDYITLVKAELHERWEKWPLDLTKREVHEVVGALMARQVTLAVHLAEAPSIWNGHIAPLILRTMTDNHINLAWIFNDPLDRSRKFIFHGLGQEKLHIEHYKAKLSADGHDPKEDPDVKLREEWLNSQRYSFMTEVNIGSWSGIDTRKMAEEAGCIDLYNYAYAPFSAATHNMWHHVAKYNLVPCPDPLHRYHKIPVILDVGIDIDYVYRAAKYVEKAFNLFDEKTSVKVDVPSAFETLAHAIERLDEMMESAESTTAEVPSEPPE